MRVAGIPLLIPLLSQCPLSPRSRSFCGSSVTLHPLSICVFRVRSADGWTIVFKTAVLVWKCIHIHDVAAGYLQQLSVYRWETSEVSVGCGLSQLGVDYAHLPRVRRTDRHQSDGQVLCLVHTANTDETRLSCLVLSVSAVSELNWRQVKTVCDWKFRNSFVQSRNTVCESCLVLKMRSHRRQDKTVLSPIYWKLSATVANSVHTADKTRQDSVVLSVFAVWTSHYILHGHGEQQSVILLCATITSQWTCSSGRWMAYHFGQWWTPPSAVVVFLRFWRTLGSPISVPIP